MKSLDSGIARFGVVLLGIVSLALVLPAREDSSSLNRISMPHDWSHRHVIFSKPSTNEQAMRVRQDARFWHQYYRRNLVQAPPTLEPADDEFGRNEETLEGRLWWRHRRRRAPHSVSGLKRDWAASLGPNATVGAGNYPAKFSFDVTTANCGSAAQPDFVVYNTSVVGSNTQASIVAYDNLYTGCGGTVPTTYWAYNSGGAVITSVVLSLDGSQVAFIQSPFVGQPQSQARLVLLKWKASTDGATSTAPDPIDSVAPSLYPSCTAPCMTTLAFNGAQGDTNSSPFYDYFNDALYVGDDSGSLHKFQPVFGKTGAPSEVVGGLTSWPVAVAAGLELSSPVYDSGTGRVFVLSAFNGISTGGQLFSVDAATGNIVQTSSQIHRSGIPIGPIVDSTAGLLYVFVSTDAGTVMCVNGGSPCSAVYQFSTSSISGAGRETPVSWGSADIGFQIYLGAFDNSYYTSTNATGALYVCGQEGGSAHLFKVSIVSGFMSPFPTNDGFLAGSSLVPCSPITEVFNPNLNSGVDSGGPQGTDRIFLSTLGPGNSSPCGRSGNGDCLFSFPATSWQPGTPYQVGQVILDDGRGMCIQIVTTAGISNATTEPNWGVNAGVATVDGSVTWTGKTCLSAVIPPSGWLPGVSWGVGFSNIDTNGNLEAVSNVGTTGGTQPNWPLTIGALTLDGTETWVNVGPVDVSTLLMHGTSGIVVDNTVPTGTLAGGSQIYFSPLVTGFNCGANNGCAMQASQAGLN